MAKIIGIDLGTTNSAFAVVEGGQPKIIPSAEGRNVTPSVVDPVKGVVGDVAKRQLLVNPKNTVFSVKRLMGKRFADASVQFDLKWLPYTIKGGKNGMAVIEVEGKEYTPQEISALILGKIKADAEAFLGEEIKSAVITVPAYFDDSQRQATKQAGEIAGFEVKRIINEPTAAALAYGLDKKSQEKIAVYDLGGGTFDISILEVGEGVFEVKATAGDTHLGGDDFDRLIIEFLEEQFRKEEGVDLKKDTQAMQRIRDAAEKAKIELSSTQEAEISIPYITVIDKGPLHLSYKLTRAKLEQLVDNLIAKTFESVRQALSDAKLSPQDIDEVILVGGMTRMPAVYAAVKSFFGKEPHKGVNPDEVVAIGAAIQGAVLGGEIEEVTLIDVTPLSLGVETLGGVATKLIERNTAIPTSVSEVFSTAADNQTSVEIHVLQGERQMAQDNKSLGRFLLEGIPPSPRGAPQIEVTFDIDSNGILNVIAKDKATTKEQKITISGTTGLSKEEVEKMMADSQAHAEEDRKKKEQIEAKNQADMLSYTAEKVLKEQGEKVPSDLRREIEEKIKALRAVLETASVEELRQKTADLSSSLSKIGQAMYGQPPQGGPQTPP